MEDFEAARKIVAEHLESNGWEKDRQWEYKKETKVGRDIIRLTKTGIYLSNLNFISGEGQSVLCPYDDCVINNDGIFARVV